MCAGPVLRPADKEQFVLVPLGKRNIEILVKRRKRPADGIDQINFGVGVDADPSVRQAISFEEAFVAVFLRQLQLTRFRAVNIDQLKIARLFCSGQ